MTSTWCPVRQTQVAVLITILNNKDYKSYMIHWRHLFEIYGHNRHRLRDPVNPAASFHDGWPGNTSDFSEALFKGFFESMDEFCEKKYGETLTKPEKSDLYGFCSVHFKRNLYRTANISAAVDVRRKEYFIRETLTLLTETSKVACTSKVRKLLHEFPLLAS
jgi:hypothetical protein